MIATARRKWLALALLLRRAVHGRARHRDRERRPSVHPDRPRVLAGEPPVGRERLRALLRRLPPARRAGLPTSSAGAACSSPGSIVFTGASLLSGLAWSEAALIGARALQGLGAAMITPAALSILSTTFAEGKERNAALGAWGAVGAFGAVAGVLLGGVLTDWLSWEWIFFVNIPVGVLGLVLAPMLLTESRDARVKSFDVPGAVLVTERARRARLRDSPAGNHYGWGSVETIGLFAASAALLGSFLVWEARTRRAADAVLDLPPAHGRRRERRRADPRDGAVRDVPRCSRCTCSRCSGTRRMRTGVGVPRGGRHGDPLVRRRGTAREPRRREAGARRGDGVHVRGASVLHAGVGRRLVRRRPPPRVPADLDRDGLLVRADLDRGARGRATVRRRVSRRG